MKYKLHLDATIKRETTFESNKTKAYSLIWERCLLSMEGQIEQKNDSEKEIYNNPINLINAIKEQTLNFQDTKNKMEIINNSLIHFSPDQKRTKNFMYIQKDSNLPNKF